MESQNFRNSFQLTDVLSTLSCMENLPSILLLDKKSSFRQDIKEGKIVNECILGLIIVPKVVFTLDP